jgi:hypothetical protein
MLSCPLCKKKVPPLERECPSCHADLSLLADYVGHLAGGLDRAEALTRAGRLDEAVTAYLEVLEVDPDNAIARRQVGRVVAAVRQFDSVARSRRWLKQLQRRTRFRRWMASWDDKDDAWGGLYWLLLIVAALCLLYFGYLLGQRAALSTELSPPSSRQSVLERENRNHVHEAPSLRHAHHPRGGARPGPPPLRGRNLDRTTAAAV